VAAGYTGERCSLEGGKVEANSKEDTRFGCSPDYSSEKDMVVEIVREDSHYSQHVAEPASRQNLVCVRCLLPEPRDWWSTS
jgi:protein-arginine kinase activator protein McsA